jgi:hypothetical protein
MKRKYYRKPSHTLPRFVSGCRARPQQTCCACTMRHLWLPLEDHFRYGSFGMMSPRPDFSSVAFVGLPWSSQPHSW